MIEPLANIATGLIAASTAGAGVYLGTISNLDPIIKLTAQIASPIFAYLAAQKVPYSSSAKLGAIGVGIMLGTAMAIQPDTILKNSCCLVAITGLGGYLAKIW